MLSQIAIPHDEITKLCRIHKIKYLMLFGSVLREDFSSDSDIDILVEFQPDHIPGFLKFSLIQRELSTLLGRKVDLSTPNSLSPYFRQEVLEMAQVIYEENT
jgi:predicted nucleotidyltransferase